MRWARWSIAGLMGVVGLIGAGFAALANPTQLGAIGLVWLEYLLLFTALLGILGLRGVDRATCVGFALFGWGYVLLSFSSLLSPAATRYAGWGYPAYPSQEGVAILTPAELARELLDAIDTRKRIMSLTVGESVEVLWNGTYYPSKITEINGDTFKIRYDSDPRGTFDEWVTTAKARGILSPHYYCIGHSLAALLSAFMGAAAARGLWTFARQRYQAIGETAQPDVSSL